MSINRDFTINSIKMDLHRVVTAAGNIMVELPKQSITEFMNHAQLDLEKIELTQREKTLKDKLSYLLNQLDEIKDPHQRLRWAEDVMTVRCRL